MSETREEQVYVKKQVMIALAALLCPFKGGLSPFWALAEGARYDALIIVLCEGQARCT